MASLPRLAADQAGQLLLALRTNSGLRGDALGRAGDAQANASIVALLAQHRPDDAVLSEEQPSAASRLQHRRVWIVDPLDGTREYGEPAHAPIGPCTWRYASTAFQPPARWRCRA